MARVHPFQTNFTAGELSPLLAGQTDFKKYVNGVETMENMVVFPQGGATRRNGTRYVAEVKNSEDAVRLIPFEFNVTQAYILEFGNLYIRFYKDNGQITLADKTITNITQSSTPVVTIDTHGYVTGDDIYINSVVGMTNINGSRYRITRIDDDTFSLDSTNTSSFTAYASGGFAEKVFEIVSPYTADKLYDLQITQSADVMYIVHNSLPPQKLSRTGHTSWTIEDSLFKNGPFLDKNTGNRTLSSNSTSGTNRTLTANNADFKTENGIQGWHSGDIGRQVKLTSGYGVITSIDSATVARWTIKETIGANGTNWYLGAWSGGSGYPVSVSFYEQRLVFGGSSYYPQTVWASQSGIYDDFDTGTSLAGDAFIYTIAANRVNTIRWLAPARDLIVGTSGGEFKVGRPTGEPLKPDNVSITQQTTYGGWTTQPTQIGNVVLFVQKQRRKIREFTYRFEDDAYTAPDMTLLAEHITGTGIIDVDYAQEPDSIYWAVRDDGVLLGMTYERGEDVIAWHTHTIGGYNQFDFNHGSVTNYTTDSENDGYITLSSHGYSTGDKVEVVIGTGGTIQGLVNNDTYFVVVEDANKVKLAKDYQQAIDGTTVQIGTATGDGHAIRQIAKVLTVSSISENTENQTWIVVERRINNVKRKFVEYLDPLLHMDCALSGLINGNSSTITGLEYLEGQVVQILIGDAVYPDQTVSNGEVTITGVSSSSGTKSLEIGLKYVSKIKTMRIEAGSKAGTAQGLKKRFNEVMVRLHDTVGVTINGDQLPFRTSSTPTSQSIPKFTGDKRVTNLGWGKDGQIVIEQTQPLPMTVLGISGTLNTSD